MKRIIPSLPAYHDVDMKVDPARQMFLKTQGQMHGDSQGWKHFKPAKDGFRTGDFELPRPVEKQSPHLDMVRGEREGAKHLDRYRRFNNVCHTGPQTQQCDTSLSLVLPRFSSPSSMH